MTCTRAVRHCYTANGTGDRFIKYPLHHCNKLFVSNSSEFTRGNATDIRRAFYTRIVIVVVVACCSECKQLQYIIVKYSDLFVRRHSNFELIEIEKRS